MFRSAISNSFRAATRPARLSPIVRPALATRARGYHQNVIDHYENPKNVGSMPKTDVDVGTGLVGAPACGDVMKLQIRVDDNGVISEAKFKTFGCGSAIASSSYMTQAVLGMTLEQAGQIKNKDIAKDLCLPPVKFHCSMLAEDAIKSAIKDYQTKRKTASQARSDQKIDVSQPSSTPAEPTVHA